MRAYFGVTQDILPTASQTGEPIHVGGTRTALDSSAVEGFPSPERPTDNGCRMLLIDASWGFLWSLTPRECPSVSTHSIIRRVPSRRAAIRFLHLRQRRLYPKLAHRFRQGCRVDRRAGVTVGLSERRATESRRRGGHEGRRSKQRLWRCSTEVGIGGGGGRVAYSRHGEGSVTDDGLAHLTCTNHRKCMKTAVQRVVSLGP